VVAPTLCPEQVVLADNLSAHKSERAQDILAECGCSLVYLPPYSPEYSPIELAFAQIKADLRPPMPPARVRHWRPLSPPL